MVRPLKGRGLFHTRDSGGKHEMTPAAYLRWANQRAAELGVAFCVADDTIDLMVANRQAVYGDVYLDYDVCGNQLSRPALDALKARIDADKSVTHLFIPRRDRLCRPDDPTDGLMLEISLRRSGITIVFKDKVLAPLARGERIDIGDMVTGVVDYDKAGKDRRELAQKIIDAQLTLARAGFSTGGRPCYGFRRWLVRLDGTRERQLKDLERVRMAGHHVVWLPVPDDHSEMILIRRIREQLKTTPASRLARQLTEEGIPSPDAGRTRREKKTGITHIVSGVWHQATVVNIGRNELLAAVSSYGRRSMGDQLRFAPGGPRALTNEDYRDDNQPKVVQNPPEIIQKTKAKFEPLVTTAEHDELQVILDARSESQRGKPKSHDPNRNPLGTRVFDMHCGWPMYRAPYNGSFRYVCGLYGQSHGAKCGHHHVDGPTATRLVINTIVQKVLTPSGMAKLRNRLDAMAAAEASKAGVDPSLGIRRDLDQLKAEQKTVERNMALSTTAEQREAVSRIFDENLEAIAKLEKQLSEQRSVSPPIDPATEVKVALSALNYLPRLLEKAADFAALSTAIELVNAKMFLRFTSKQLTKRLVNKASRALVTFGDEPPPVMLYAGPTGRRALQSNTVAALATSSGGGVPRTGEVSSGTEGKSLGNVSRGDRI